MLIKKTVMNRKIELAIVELSKKLNKSELDALQLFYSTNVYKELVEQETTLCTESYSFISDEVLRELNIYEKPRVIFH
ncbi:hypothetical protein [Clostridium botulinum]|uniref:hypothetical protein n=1 Tax=Clostridium botulinum TaxID=1491 RepID=UPI000773658D|nr:hypothetical protein [Clostridium botulinum]NFE93579.1 hypothetical protein [Clostridium botulinum]NFL38140.1 hypothetical protein [Clostridium botulinum]NFL64372.1 hypothetical protein [Clostridium botulinum]NFN07919.1 hypothetical protein [Clostridium botulinum]NFN24176.1 hypothetical protein [Clostridium botulinum]